jgi:UDP-N-acetylglucosamine acyltransferase
LEEEGLMQNNNSIDSTFKHGNNFVIGDYNVIKDDVKVGDNVEICNYVLLKKGSRVGNNCYIDSYSLSSGSNKIGNNVIVRYGTYIARNVIVEDNVFFSAGVKTIYIDQKRNKTTKKTIIGEGCFIGDNVVIMNSVHIGKHCIIGACSFINKDLDAEGVYIGSPAKRIRDVTLEELESVNLAHEK